MKFSESTGFHRKSGGRGWACGYRTACIPLKLQATRHGCTAIMQAVKQVQPATVERNLTRPGNVEPTPDTEKRGQE
jgi:hypothetical protein